MTRPPQGCREKIVPLLVQVCSGQTGCRHCWALSLRAANTEPSIRRIQGDRFSQAYGRWLITLDFSHVKGHLLLLEQTLWLWISLLCVQCFDLNDHPNAFYTMVFYAAVVHDQETNSKQSLAMGPYGTLPPPMFLLVIWEFHTTQLNHTRCDARSPQVTPPTLSPPCSKNPTKSNLCCP